VLGTSCDGNTAKVRKGNAPDAQSLAKSWFKGFEQRDNWIGQHVDTDTGIPLAFAIRTTNLITAYSARKIICRWTMNMLVAQECATTPEDHTVGQERCNERCGIFYNKIFQAWEEVPVP
jgi:hypothetical protein